MSRILTLISISVLLAGCGGSAESVPPPPPIVVTSLADNGSGTLRQALDDAVHGTRISFDPALGGGTISLFSELKVQASVTIEGPATGAITLDGNGNVRHFNVSSQLSFRILNLDHHEVTGDSRQERESDE